MTEATVRPRRDMVTQWTVNVDAIDRARILHGWTQIELSRVAHVDRGTLADLVHRRRRPTLGTVQAIATALGLTLAEVIVFLESWSAPDANRADCASLTDR